MHIKSAVHMLTQQLHRLGWRTEQSLGVLESWRAGRINTEEFHDRIEDLLSLDLEELTADELADLDLFRDTMQAIKTQPR